MVRSYSHVPEEVFEEIFSWLPPESLIRFKCVCKSWYSLITSLINDSDFVAKHLHNAHNNILSPKSILIIGQYSEQCLISSFDNEESILLLNISSDYGEEEEILSFLEELEVRSPFGGGYMSDKEFYRMMGAHISEAEFYHCDGIICLIGHKDTMLWNPALRVSKLLRRPKYAYDLLYSHEVGKTGFGYDPIANDYKVLRIWSNEIFEIYSLNTNSWRYIKKGFDEQEYWMQDGMQVCCKGICYWFLYSKKNMNHMMLSFDLHAEEFCIIPLPDPLAIWKSLKLWIDSIAFLSFHLKGERTGKIEMWVMKYCSNVVNDSSFWIKYLSIVPQDCIQPPLTFWKNDELLLKVIDGGFVSYNLCTQKLRKLTNRRLDDMRYWGPYVKSLISVNR